jgi:hypothetical protein
MGRLFYIYKRSTSGIFYAEILDPKGKRLGSRSTGKTNRDEAVLVADRWAREGLPDSSGKLRPIAEAASLEELLGLIRAAAAVLAFRGLRVGALPSLTIRAGRARYAPTLRRDDGDQAIRLDPQAGD